MSKLILDASAVIAYFKNEAGFKVVASMLPDGMMSTVNITEAATKLIDLGHSDEEAARWIAQLPITIVAFDEEQALAAAALRRPTVQRGLSLADRACLALARREQAPVLTADRAWAGLDLGVEVVLIR